MTASLLPVLHSTLATYLSGVLTVVKQRGDWEYKNAVRFPKQLSNSGNNLKTEPITV